MPSKKNANSSWYKKVNWIFAFGGILLLIFNFVWLVDNGEVNDLLLIMLSLAALFWILLEIIDRKEQ